MIYKYPHKILLTKSTEVTLEEGREIAKQLQDEIKKLTWGECVGLAAPQIGINKRVFVALDLVYINPEIIFYSDDIREYQEGCYSLEKNRHNYKVHRSYMVKMRYTNLKGGLCETNFSGFGAEVIQHEYDHLEGRLCNHEEI